MSKGRTVKLLVSAKVLDEEHCARNCPALDRGVLSGYECLRLWKDNCNTKLEEKDRKICRCAACKKAETDACRHNLWVA